MKRKVLSLALLSLAAGQPAMAATCWSTTATEAAQIKQFDIMLMVATLRCRSKGMDLTSDYNQFVRDKRPVLRAVGDEIVRQFNSSMGGKAAFDAYDHLTVVMANRFGNGVEGVDCSDTRAMIADANAAPANRDSLVGLAQRAGMEPPLPNPRCGQPLVAAASSPPTLVAPGGSAPALAGPAMATTALVGVAPGSGQVPVQAMAVTTGSAEGVAGHGAP